MKRVSNEALKALRNRELSIQSLVEIKPLDGRKLTFTAERIVKKAERKKWK